ncbi:MAG: hypothetical protein ABJ370_05950 [Paracoccaceae bacterium]
MIRLKVSNQHSFTGNAIQLQPIDQSLTQAFADNSGSSASPDVVLALGRHVASQTVCQGLSVVPSTGRRYSGSEASAILVANQGRLTGAKIPPNLRGQPTPATEFSKFGWKTNLMCE